MTTTATPTEPSLGILQRARAEALREARTVLAVRGPLTTGPVDPVDLVTVAQWILDGQDPWPPRTPSRDLEQAAWRKLIEQGLATGQLVKVSDEYGGTYRKLRDATPRGWWARASGRKEADNA
jgi:hypothetical protein